MVSTDEALDDQILAWLALNRLYKLRPKTVQQLIATFGDAATALHASPATIEGSGFDLKVAIELQKADWAAAEQDMQWLNEADERHVLTLQDSRYPPLLKTIDDAPPVLFALGDIEVLQVPQLAMVGSRNPTSTGRKTAELFAEHLAQRGLTITSGLALGVDGAAHEGALRGQGLTVAVCATGLDRIYPARHHDLGKRILQEGVLISEFSPGTPGRPANFPRRNRIISGLSLGTLVVEAAERSGSLITARLANEQGREVFAIPGSINNPLARGCHKLIKQGAKLVESADDILHELADQLSNADWQANANPTTSSSSCNKNYPQEIGDTEKNLLQLIPYEPIAVDALVASSGITAHELASLLMDMELSGLIEAVPGGAVIRK